MEGREIMFTAKRGNQKLRIVFPAALLDESCGPDASEAVRTRWAKTRKPGILDALSRNREQSAIETGILIEEVT